MKGVFHREKHREVGQTERRVLLAEGFLHDEIFLLFMLYGILRFARMNEEQCLPINSKA